MNIMLKTQNKKKKRYMFQFLNKTSINTHIGFQNLKNGHVLEIRDIYTQPKLTMIFKSFFVAAFFNKYPGI